MITVKGIVNTLLFVVLMVMCLLLAVMAYIYVGIAQAQPTTAAMLLTSALSLATALGGVALFVAAKRWFL